ncbi:MAG: hypothetical protein WEC59_03055 [Salibacteraceae bacterium]
MSEYKKFLFPAVLTIIGIFLIIYGYATEQNGAFLFGAFGVFLAGAISVVSTVVQLSKTIRLGIIAVLVILVGSLAYADYVSIKVPIEFQKEKKRRYVHVVQRLKDIRTAEIGYKAKYQKYTSNLDSLVHFVKHDSIAFIKAFGNVPDTMTQEEAIKKGIVTRDTNYVAVKDSLFGGKAALNRVHKFHPDSMIYVPFSGGAKFDLEAGTVERSGVDVQVFQATDSKPFDPRDPLQVGSMNDPKTNGNWE